MDKINFNQTGGLPLSTDVLNNMQEAYKIFNQFANLLSKEAVKNIIVAGCNVAGNTASEGFVIIDNELLPFAGGTVQEYVYIKNETTKRSFKDGTEKEVETKRTVHFGTDPKGQGRKWAYFVTLLSLAELNERISQTTRTLSQKDAELDGKITSINDVLLKSKVIKKDITAVENVIENITINHGLNNSNIILYTVETKLEIDDLWQSHENKYLQRRDNNQIYVFGLGDITTMSLAGVVKCWIRVNIIYKAN